MKTNWWIVFYWSLIAIGFALMLARVSGYYAIPRIGGILLVIGTVCLQTYGNEKKDKIEE
jgi:hypothetical protein